MSALQPIIIVKKKHKHGGHHGGAWKVAYADFVTAMMAFFLVMWLVGQSKEVKAGVGGYFRDPAAFDAGGGKGILDGSTSPTPAVSPQAADAEAERRRLEDAVAHMRNTLAQLPGFDALRDQVEFNVTPEGLRIDLVEKDNSSFFDSGSATLRGETEHILAIIARELGTLEDGVDVEGHTDSRPYAAGDRYSNWELSADRANAARRVMEREGLRAKQVESVRGLADRQLRVADRPFDSSNRRVSILVKSALLAAAAAAPSAAAPSARADGPRPNVAAASPAPSTADRAAATAAAPAPVPAAAVAPRLMDAAAALEMERALAAPAGAAGSGPDAAGQRRRDGARSTSQAAPGARRE
jgi:chemotaxis protein MotB